MNTQPSDLESDALPLRHGVDTRRGMEKNVIPPIRMQNSKNNDIYLPMNVQKKSVLVAIIVVISICKCERRLSEPCHVEVSVV